MALEGKDNDSNGDLYGFCSGGEQTKIAGLELNQVRNAAIEYKIGKKLGMSKNALIAAAVAALVESHYNNYENPRYLEVTQGKGDGMPPGGGDLDSAGIHQIRWEIHKNWFGNDPDKFMNVEEQARWFFERVKPIIEAQADATPGAIAASVEKPQESLRYKYSEVEEQAKNIIAALEGGISCFDKGLGAQAIVSYAQKWLDTPYAWGGGNEYGPSRGTGDGGIADLFGDYKKIGFDCSGLVLYAVYQASGGRIVLPHNTRSQMSSGLGIEITDVNNLQTGDIIYTNEDHVVIYVGLDKDGNHRIIHAPQSGDVVRYGTWEEFGLSHIKILRFSIDAQQGNRTDRNNQHSPSTSTSQPSPHDIKENEHEKTNN